MPPRWFLGRPNDSALPAGSGYFLAHCWICELDVPSHELVTWDYAQARSALASVA